jgi:antigen flippase
MNPAPDGESVTVSTTELSSVVESAQAKADRSSYSQILRSSSIIGGAQGINYLIGMVRMKAVALLIGPSGVGLVGMYVTIYSFLGAVCQMGIDQSGVRDVAEANSSGDSETVARITKTVQRFSWVAGLIGWILAAVFAWPISRWVFGSPDYTLQVAIVGVAIFLNVISAGQAAVLQGMRRILDLAKMQVFSALVSTFAAVGLYFWLGTSGIIPVLIVTAAIQLVLTSYYSRKIDLEPIQQTWRDTSRDSRRLIQLGAAFTYGALLNGLVTLLIRAVIVRNLGIDANGIYQAAWGISGMFAGFVVSAMGTDFYPRLISVCNDNKQVNRLVNQQMEIGILLAIPGLIGTMVFAPIVMHVFYSSKFLEGAELLPWFVLSSFVQVLMFPMGFIARAKRATRWIYVTQTWSNLSYLAIAMLMISIFGLNGIGYASLLSISIFCLLIFFLARHLSSFEFTGGPVKLFAVCCTLILLALSAKYIPNPSAALGFGLLLTSLASIVSLRGIASRLGNDHRMIQFILKVPGARFICN